MSYRLAKPDWRYVPVSLAPALVAWAISVRLLGLAFARSDALALILCLAFTLLYQTTCVIDYYDAYYFIRHRTYPPEDRSLPALPLISQRWWDSKKTHDESK